MGAMPVPLHYKFPLLIFLRALSTTVLTKSSCCLFLGQAQYFSIFILGRHTSLLPFTAPSSNLISHPLHFDPDLSETPSAMAPNKSGLDTIVPPGISLQTTTSPSQCYLVLPLPTSTKSHPNSSLAVDRQLLTCLGLHQFINLVPTTFEPPR